MLETGTNEVDISKEMIFINEELESFLVKILLDIYKFLDQLSEKNQVIFEG